MISEWIKHQVIGSPLHRPAEYLRELATIRKRMRNPELSHIFLEGSRSRSVIANSVKDGQNCVDVGCHLGSVLSEFLRNSPSGQHIAIEPMPYKATWLRKKFPKARIVEAAISDVEGEVEFTWNKSRPGFSSLAADGPKGDQLERITVNTQRLDDIVPVDQQISFMKVDVEGAELLAFRTAERILSVDRPIVLFECARRSTTAMGFEVDQVYELLTKGYSYSVMYLHEFLSDRRPLELEEFKQAMFYPFQAFNFVALPN